MKNKTIIMIGPSRYSKGGIASVIASYEDSGLFDKFPIEYLSTHAEGRKLLKLWVALSTGMKFIGLLLTGKVLFLHAHVARWNSFWRKSIFMAFSLLFSCPYIIHIHSGGFRAFYEKDCNNFQRRIIDFFLRRAENIIVLTQETSQWLLSITRVDRVIVLPNFIQIDLNHSNHVNRKKGQVIFLGRFTEEKGIYDLLEVLPHVIAKKPDVKLILCGDGDTSGVKNKINQLRIGKYIKLLGWVTGDEKNKVLQESQVFVLPSYVEGLPIGILEAMQNACPVVATKVGGVPDQIENGLQGILFEAGDKKALELALLKLLNNEELCEQMGREGVITVKNRFSDLAVIPQLESIYKAIDV